ncbi:receptor-like protein 9DC3 [Solanum stenotomum]|uniref:receptor-like protein 9DC3 n=1 Tax=Solanum stenotomum TaxID=172797 RepID=UPI0020D01709|nr:receptor-like protein 9DC3 [Solanum stenotomum]
MVLDLRKNNFTGNLPPLCAHSTSLSTIVVNGNRFEGLVHVSLLKCNGQQVLDVGNNAINDTFPAWLRILQELQVLILKSNKLHGPTSTWQTKFCFPKLRIFDLSRNDFSGSLPAKVFGNFKAMIKLEGEDTEEIKYMELNSSFDASYEDSVSLVIKGRDIELERISTIMTTIDLSSNHFEGVIPKTLKDLSSLWLLNLSHNNLRGHIPMELGQLNTLEALDLSWNQLTGKIPQELTRLNFLSFLNVSQNHLIGPIPQVRQFNTFENDSYGGNLDLCGLPLTKKCGTSDSSHVPQQLESEEEGESYFFSGFTWESVVIGYSCGLVVGTVMWSLMFKYRKPKCIFQLHHLQALNLAYNDFNPSSIPHNIGRLRYLNLSWSSFDGKIPTEISYLSNLVSLHLSGYDLQLDERTFETMLHNFTNLELLALPLVDISSPIPVNISSSSLWYVDLTVTNLRGVLTESFFLQPNLENLNLGDNSLLKGVLPKIHPSNTLLKLDISFTGISGELPDSIGTLSSLNYLNLHGCDFSGHIPDSIGNLIQIRELWFWGNRFTGHIPSTISKLKHLTRLDLPSNSFSGEIHDVFSNLQQLRYFDLSDNSFIGPFPSSILREMLMES